MLIAGIVLLVLAAAAGGYAWWQDRKHDELTAVEASSCADMRQLADAVSVDAGGVAFRQRCELNGTAQPAYVGTVQAPQTKKECVWYRNKVTHEYWDYEWVERNGKRERDRTRRTETVSDDTSDIPFALDDGTGQAVIHPEEADIHGPHEVFDEFESDRSRPGLLDMFADQWRDETIGYRREEWILPVGTKLFVQGEMTDEDGHLRLRKPESGTFRVSTSSEEELLASAASGRKWATIGAGALAVVGLVLVVVGLLA
jgi:hypothetical protein